MKKCSVLFCIRTIIVMTMILLEHNKFRTYHVKVGFTAYADGEK